MKMAQPSNGTIELRFPIGGVVKRYAYQSQPPYTTPEASNVRPYETLERRERGGSRPGTEKAFAAVLGAPSPVQCLAAATSRDESTLAITSKAFAAANGVAYRESAGNLVAFGGSVNLDSSAATLQAAELGQKLYVADYGSRKAYGTNGTAAGANELHSATYDEPADPNWTELNPAIDVNNDVCIVVPNAGATIVQGTYPIASVEAGHIHLTGFDGTKAGTCTFEIGRGIKVYDPKADTFTALVPTTGAPPIRSSLICPYRGRLVLAGGPVWYTSRLGDPLDWDYTVDAEDPGAAVAGTAAGAGQLGEPSVALVPQVDDYLLFGCTNSIWVCRGDPGYGGGLGPLTEKLGFVGPNAWCSLPDFSILFLSRSGLYFIPPGLRGDPTPFSPEYLPSDLIDVDASSNAVSMLYDVRDRGIHFFITPTAGTAGTHWWIDWTTKKFWSVTLPNDQQPRVLAAYAGTPAAARNVLLGCHDGYVRRFNASATTDDGTALSSSIKYGPIPLGPDGYEGILTELHAILDGSSGSVSWEVRVGNSPEAAVASTTAMASGTWVAGTNPRENPQVGGLAAVLYLSSTSRWAIERILAIRVPSGRYRP